MPISTQWTKSKITYLAEDKSDLIHLRQLAARLPGLNMSKKEPLARSKQDMILLSQIITTCRKYNFDFYLDPETKSWYNEEVRTTKKFAEIFKSSDMELDISYSSKLRPYQRVDVNLMSQMKRLILGNDPGTGKTLECIALADLVKAEKILVLCPLSLIGSWRDEINKWSDDADTKIIPPASNYKRDEKIRENLRENHRWNISNYSILQKGYSKQLNLYKAREIYPELFKQEWDLIIVDEAHRLQNNATQLHIGLSQLKTEHLVFATGTSMTKNHQDIFGLLKLIEPKLFTSKWDFLEMYNETQEQTIRTRSKNIVTKEVLGPKNIQLFRYMLSRHMIRRRKEDVLTELPEVIHKTVRLQLTPKDMKDYKAIEQDMLALIGDSADGNEQVIISQNVLAQQVQLRKFLLDKSLVLDKVPANYSSPKVEAILDIVDSSDDTKIVFSTSTKFLDILEAKLSDYRVAKITGAVPFEERQEVINKLNRGELDVILGSTQAMSEGLNMQASHTIILADKTWVPADQIQAIARAHRMGQESDSVLVYHLVIEDTLDELIEMVNTQRTELVDEMSALHLVLPMIMGLN